MWFREYVSVGEKSVRAQRKRTQLKKKRKDINPVIVEGNKIAKSWWGQAWINHLKHYADFDSRVGRGRSYVKNGFVIHLATTSGHIEALVMGTRATPYKVEIKIDKIKKNKWRAMKTLSRKHLHTLSDLLEGNFPKELKGIFSDERNGIFPALKEMKFNCSCPDWAYMCKHVSASLFGLGVRLDENLDLFFNLRGVNIDELIQSALEGEARSLQKRKSANSNRVLKLTEKRLASLFDLNLVTPKKSKRK